MTNINQMNKRKAVEAKLKIESKLGERLAEIHFQRKEFKLSPIVFGDDYYRFEGLSYEYTQKNISSLEANMLLLKYKLKKI